MMKEYWKGLPTLLSLPGGTVQNQITLFPGKSGLAGVRKDRSIHFDDL